MDQGTNIIRSLILLLYGGTLLVLALRSLRAQRLKERYVVVLILTGLPFLLLAVWPNGISRLANLMGMPYHTVLILLLAGFLIVELFELLSIISIQERRIASLAQMVGILMERHRTAELGGNPLLSDTESAAKEQRRPH